MSTRLDMCYNCGSTIEGRHTRTCDRVFSDGQVNDLPDKLNDPILGYRG